MAFKEVADLDCDTTVSLGGVNKKTGKSNPKAIEGYYLGKKKVEDRKKKSGFTYIYAFQTPKGKVGVWGKTDMDRKMEAAVEGALTRISHSGMRSTPNGEMYVYKVEIDTDETIEVGISATANNDDAGAQDEEQGEYKTLGQDDDVDAQDDGAEDTLDEDEAPVDEVKPARAASRPVSTPDAARQAKVQALLKGRRA